MANNFMEEIYGEDYIEHHGVKGMRWGVRKKDPERSARRKQAKQYQKDLNKIDRRMRYDVMEFSNAAGTKQRFNREADRARRKGNLEEAAKKTAKAKQMDSIMNDLQQDYINTGKAYAEKITKMGSEGYRFKVKNLNFASVSYSEYQSRTKEMVSKYGKYRTDFYANTASGNYWTVKDASQVSDKRYQKWVDEKHSLYTHKPGKVIYY